MNLSVILIVHNESANLGSCLDTVTSADELVIVEHGSSDNTLEIASSFGARVVTTPDWPGFGAQKNRALDGATSEWVLSLDADERVTPALMTEIRMAIASGAADGYRIPRLTQFCGKWIRHCGWTPDEVLRLFKNGAARFSDDRVHEKLLMQEARRPVYSLNNPLLHYSYPTPGHYWEKLQRYSHDWALQQHQRGKRTSIFRAAFSGGYAFIKSYFFRLGFLDGAMGFVVCVLQAQAAFGKYFELYWLNKNNEQ